MTQNADCKPCPFCDYHKPMIVTYEENKYRPRREYAVLCEYNPGKGCGAEGPHHVYLADTVDAWNKRASMNDVELFRRYREITSYERNSG